MTTGYHILADLYDCQCVSKLMTDHKWMSDFLQNLVLQCDLTPVGTLFHSFGANSGYTGVVVLAESHVSTHTWPEEQLVNLDVYVCNVSRDNSDKCQKIFYTLKDLYQPKTYKMQGVIR